MKIIILTLIALMLVINIVGALEKDDEMIFAQAEQIIQQKIPCNDLTSEQLEVLGDYYMEQMHPGKLHEIMDERMGGEGSASLRQVHINMGLMFYCGQRGAMSFGMMNMMMGRTSSGFGQQYGIASGMMGNMMGNNLNSYVTTNTGYSIFWIFGLILVILIAIALVLVITLLERKSRR